MKALPLNLKPNLIFQTLPKLLEAPNLENVNVKIISCGARHTAVIADEGKVFCWGWNKYGQVKSRPYRAFLNLFCSIYMCNFTNDIVVCLKQLGLGDVIDRNAPSEVRIKDCVPKNIACGWWHTLLLGQSSL